MQISYPLLIDGGLSNELEKLGCDLNNKLWSAKLLETNHKAIIKVHLAYLKSGAQCITTSSYQASVPGFMELGYSKTEAEKFILKSVHIAEEAINQFIKQEFKENKPLIAASIGPYGAYLADGSEYRGDYDVSDEQLKEFHLSRIKLLEKSSADFFACETIPSFQEAKVLAEILKDSKKEAWMSFSCKDEKHLNDGTPIVKAVKLLANHPKIFAIGVNCTAPKHISALIKLIKEKCGDKKILIYPNSGEVYNANSKTWLGLDNPELFEIMAKEWLELGADIIGGCCRIGSKHIEKLNKVLTKS